MLAWIVFWCCIAAKNVLGSVAFLWLSVVTSKWKHNSLQMCAFEHLCLPYYPDSAEVLTLIPSYRLRKLMRNLTVSTDFEGNFWRQLPQSNVLAVMLILLLTCVNTDVLLNFADRLQSETKIAYTCANSFSKVRMNFVFYYSIWIRHCMEHMNSATVQSVNVGAGNGSALISKVIVKCPRAD